MTNTTAALADPGPGVAVRRVRELTARREVFALIRTGTGAHPAIRAVLGALDGARS